MMDPKSLGLKLKAHRAKCGWSIDKCAERIGISPRYLADIERGDKVPKLETFISILNALTASADDVLQDSLAVGYQTKSNDIIKALGSLDPKQRKQALDIFHCVILTLQSN